MERVGGVGNKEEKEKEQARLVSYPDEKEGGLRSSRVEVEVEW